MTEARFLETPSGRRIAYHRLDGRGPGVIFCGGYRSDMEGSKALHLEAWARREGRAFLRFDYSGHGQSSERFEDGTIGAWFEDALAVLDSLTTGPQVVVGSSMGGWIALLLARARPERFAGLVGVAPAPDFTEDLIWSRLDAAAQAEVIASGRLLERSPYADEPYLYTAALIEDGRTRLVLRDPLPLPFPVRLLHGSGDDSVPVSVSLRLLEHASCPDLRLTVVKDADHRLSDPEALELLTTSLNEIIAAPPQSG